MTNAATRAFLRSEFFSMTLAATTQRSKLYTADLTEAERLPFQISLRIALEKISEEYVRSVSDTAHINNIQKLADDLSIKHPELLRDGCMRFGHAQKALNLYLKYLWCLKDIRRPPHFPIDSIILKKIPKFTQVRWTKLTDSSKYKSIIAAARLKSQLSGESLAAWELREYNASAA
jgi:hypothetical protein